MPQARRVDVAPERLAGWVARFADSHGEVSWSIDQETSPSSWLGTAVDGSWARLQGWGEPEGSFSPTGGWVGAPGPLWVVLVRRGGYAVAVATAAGELVAHKVGTRHVQSRTAAGGWSQQRYARRRANQADALIEAVIGHATRVLGEGEAARGPVGAVILGGDQALAHEVLETAATGPQKRLLDMPRRELWGLPDPRRSVLDDAVRRAVGVQVMVHNA